MTTALEGGEGSASRPGRSLPPGKTRYPLYRRMCGPQGRYGQVRKISPPPGFDLLTLQPLASRYTDWATHAVDMYNCKRVSYKVMGHTGFIFWTYCHVNPLNPELNPICYLLALLGTHHFLHVSRIRVKLLTFWPLMSYIYGAPILDVSRSHTTTQHSR